ncbi:collagen-like protein [uncultured Aquimarina sp.]|uniref:collagen-like triple helix repeat-containing protein n=1 Tax=uncultured Aquimarina sp. TaxID=575652 RepID=UPI002614637E|nr:collagen-like protein [uncultured Aquimarina sp.]
MKKIFTLLFLSSILFTACEGDQGPPGFDGLPGPEGPAGDVASVFEIDNVDFASTDGISASIGVTIPNQIEVFESDVALVFVVDPIATAANNGVEVWEPLPRTFLFTDGGFAQFRYNFIFDDPSGIFDLEIILESDNFTTLDTSFTQNQIFRIVIVPGAFAQNKNIDLYTMENVLSSLKLNANDIVKISLD